MSNGNTTRHLEDRTMIKDLVIQKAELKDSPILTEISKSAKAYWGYPEEWLQLWENDLTITIAQIQQHHVFKLTRETEILGFCMIIEEGELVEIEHLWIRPKYIGKGLGKHLLTEVLQNVITQSHTTLSVLADPNVVGFYEKFGLKTIQYLSGQPEGRVLPLMQSPLN